jgi:7-cyano-7-deazaguanine synthase in queuosine biosynthesis
MTSVALYSGGVDSYGMAVLCGSDVLLYCKIAGRYGDAEFRRLQTPPGWENRLQVADLRQLGAYELPDSKVIPGRNAILALVAANYGDVIQMGSVDSSTGNDKDRRFTMRFNLLCDYMFAPQRWLPEGRHVRLTLPIYHMTKASLVGECLRRGVDGQEMAERTFSCYEPVGDRPCGKCPPCGRKWAAFTVWGIDVGFDGREAIRHYIDEITPKRPAHRSVQFCVDMLDAWNGHVRPLPCRP